MINDKNRATDYRSGHELNADYHLGYSLNKNLQIGVSGYLYKQVNDDERHGESVSEDGDRGHVVAYGPVVKYQTPEFGVLVKWQQETLVGKPGSRRATLAPGGNAILSLAYRLHLLSRGASYGPYRSLRGDWCISTTVLGDFAV
ncbi:transporter [Pseudomonas sp. ZT5P21]